MVTCRKVLVAETDDPIGTASSEESHHNGLDFEPQALLKFGVSYRSSENKPFWKKTLQKSYDNKMVGSRQQSKSLRIKWYYPSTKKVVVSYFQVGLHDSCFLCFDLILFSQPISSFMFSLAFRPTQAPWPTISNINFPGAIIYLSAIQQIFYLFSPILLLNYWALW